jgi:hypothetical protein
MKSKILIFIVFVLLFASCKPKNTLKGIYRYDCGKRNGYAIWIVDGYKVRHKVYSSFLYGGNEQRYIFNPKGEIWVDNALSCEEFELTVAHELNERHLMAKFGWTYDRSHDSSLAIEVVMRKKFEAVCRGHESTLPRLPVTDYGNSKEIKDGEDSVQLQNIYRIPLGAREGIGIWIVDGYKVRATIYPDFGFSGNDLNYHFIPKNEIWLDGQISCEETEYCIATELMERRLRARGMSYSDAYLKAIDYCSALRDSMETRIKHHPAYIIPDTLTRDSGVIDPSEK